MLRRTREEGSESLFIDEVRERKAAALQVKIEIELEWETREERKRECGS